MTFNVNKAIIQKTGNHDFARDPNLAHVKLFDTHASAKVRIAAIRFLVESNDPLASPSINKAFAKERDPAVKLALAKALISLDSRARKRPDVIAALVDAYRGGDRTTRGYVLSRLKGVRDRRVTDVYIDASRDRDPGVRLNAVRVLAKLGNQRVRPTFFRALKDADPRVRKEAITALSRIHNAKSFLALVRALGDAYGEELRTVDAAIQQLVRDPVGRAAVSIELMRRGRVTNAFVEKMLASIEGERFIPRLIKTLKTHDRTARRSVARVLARFKGELVHRTFVSLLYNTSDHELRAIAASYLARRGDVRAIPELMKALASPSWSVRAAAVRFLAHIKSARAVRLLIRTMRDRKAYVRALAARALGEHKNPMATPALIAALNDTDKYVRLMAIKALGRIGDRRAAPALEAILKKNEGKLVIMAAIEALISMDVEKILVGIANPHIQALLITKLKDPNPYKRKKAAQLLGLMKARRAVPALARAATDAYPAVRRAALQALERIGGRRAVSALVKVMKRANDDLSDYGSIYYKANLAVGVAAVRALGRIGGRRAVSALIAVMKSYVHKGCIGCNVRLRNAAVRTLGTMKGVRIVPALIAELTVNRGGYFVSIRESVLWSLGQQRDPRAVPSVISEAKSDTSVRAAILALWKILGNRVVPKLTSIMNRYKIGNYPESAVYKLISKILKKINTPAAQKALKQIDEDD